jgi:hypothetical protein
MAGNKSTDDMLETLRNPRWNSPEQNPDLTPIALDCVQNGIPGVFVAHPLDPEGYGSEVWHDAKAEKYGPIGPYVAPLETVNEAMGGQINDIQVYFRGLMQPLEPGPDRQMIFSELQAAMSVQSYHFSQIPMPWDRPVEASDQVFFDQGKQAFQETVDYLNAQLKGRAVIPVPSFKSKEK